LSNPKDDGNALLSKYSVFSSASMLMSSFVLVMLVSPSKSTVVAGERPAEAGEDDAAVAVPSSVPDSSVRAVDTPGI
jgi:hypothetical protein